MAYAPATAPSSQSNFTKHHVNINSLSPHLPAYLPTPEVYNQRTIPSIYYPRKLIPLNFPSVYTTPLPTTCNPSIQTVTSRTKSCHSSYDSTTQSCLRIGLTYHSLDFAPVFSLSPNSSFSMGYSFIFDSSFIFGCSLSFYSNSSSSPSSGSNSSSCSYSSSNPSSGSNSSSCSNSGSNPSSGSSFSSNSSSSLSSGSSFSSSSNSSFSPCSGSSFSCCFSSNPL